MHCPAKPCARGDQYAAIGPAPLSATERLDEVARLLALGYLRLLARRQAENASEPNRLRGFGLDFRGGGSVMDSDARLQRRRP
jgi:hypothetical protein